jgi:hypothetical protein
MKTIDAVYSFSKIFSKIQPVVTERWGQAILFTLLQACDAVSIPALIGCQVFDLTVQVHVTSTTYREWGDDGSYRLAVHLGLDCAPETQKNKVSLSYPFIARFSSLRRSQSLILSVCVNGIAIHVQGLYTAAHKLWSDWH